MRTIRSAEPRTTGSAGSGPAGPRAERARARLDELALITAEPGRITRLYLTPEHRRAADLVARWLRDAGMAVREDEAGNVIGRIEGAQPGRPAVLLGSHIDSVIDAGRFDGPLGVVTAIAAVEALAESGERLPFPIEVAAFGDEEGVRFGSTFLGSQALAGTLDARALALRDRDGISVAEALRAYGKDPDRLTRAPPANGPYRLFLEVHIEQGPVLERKGLPVGVVTAIAGQTRLWVDLAGEAGHAGTVPMAGRRDALVAAAHAILLVERRCRAPGLVGTVGRLDVHPGASNVIPGRVGFSVDIRSADDALRQAAVADVIAGIEALVRRHRVDFEIRIQQETPAAACAPELARALSGAVAREGLAVELLVSGAGHDAMALAASMPVGMLFVRCRGGISHHPAEHADTADIDVAIRVLLRTLRELGPG